MRHIKYFCSQLHNCNSPSLPHLLLKIAFRNEIYINYPLCLHVNVSYTATLFKNCILMESRIVHDFRIPWGMILLTYWIGMNEFAIGVKTRRGREHSGAASFISFSVCVYIFVYCSLVEIRALMLFGWFSDSCIGKHPIQNNTYKYCVKTYVSFSLIWLTHKMNLFSWVVLENSSKKMYFHLHKFTIHFLIKHFPHLLIFMNSYANRFIHTFHTFIHFLTC